MKLKELEKATAMLQDIKILDNEIIEIEKMASKEVKIKVSTDQKQVNIIQNR